MWVTKIKEGMQRVETGYTEALCKVHIVKAMVFPVVMYGFESWTVKKVECRRNDALKLWCWRRLLRVPWTARSSNQSVLKEINPECSFEVLMLNWSSNTLATWCEEPTYWKTLMLGKAEGRRRRGRQRMRCVLDSITDSMDMSWSRLWEMVKDREAWHAAVHGATRSQTWLSDWTTTTNTWFLDSFCILL